MLESRTVFLQVSVRVDVTGFRCRWRGTGLWRGGVASQVLHLRSDAVVSSRETRADSDTLICIQG